MKKLIRHPLFLRFFKKLTQHFSFPIRLKVLESRLPKYLTSAHKVLDFGSSNGRLAYLLSKKAKFTAIGVDTHILPKTYIKIKKYDGRKLPFPDKSFDTVLIIDVLHHDLEPEKILAEAKRVAKETILIKDHFWQNKFDFLLLKICDFIGNVPYGIYCPYNFFTQSDWQRLFSQLALIPVKTETFRFMPLDPCRHVIYSLKILSE